MKCKSEITETMLKELNAKTKLLYLIILIIGIVGIVSYIVLAVIDYSSNFSSYLLFVSAFYFAFGLILLVMANSNIKKQLAEKKYDEYEFLDDFIIATSFKNGEQIATAKYKYYEFVKIKETEHYLFLYPNKFSALGLPKDQFKKEEFDLVCTKVKVNKK